MLTIDGLASWTVTREGPGWQLYDGRPDHVPQPSSGSPARAATSVMARGLPASEAEAAFSLDGDLQLARRTPSVIAAMVGR